MKRLSWPHFLGIWLIINLLQSAFTELFHDEAHFWMFSQHLDWGFWDHPPAAPLLIFLGYALIPNELGVRLFMVLASVLTIFLIYRLLRPADDRLFFLLVFSIFLIHIGGFMAAPDIPLLLATAAFFFAYRHYAGQDRWQTALLLGLIVAAMAYSKYHGAVILLFALLGNLSLLRRPSFYLIPFVALLLFLPHLHWQWVRDFPTFHYHLVDRGQDEYHWTFVLDYIGGQLLVLGPFVAIPLLIAAFRQKPADAFERSLKWSMIGVFGFFLFRSFSERTEANWTATAIVPLIYLSYRFLEDRQIWQRWIYRLAIPSFALFFLFRLYLIVDFLPTENKARNEFHGWDRWAADISALAGERPVVFYNSYRSPSKYQFYSGKFAHALNTWGQSGNQYDLMPEQAERLQGKEVVIVSQELDDETPIFPGGIQHTFYKIVDDYRSYSYPRVWVEIDDPPAALPPDTTVLLHIRISNRTDHEIDFTAGSRPVDLYFHVYDRNEPVLFDCALEQLPFDRLRPRETVETIALLATPTSPGAYRYRFTFHVRGLHNGRNGHFHELRVM